MGSRHSLRNLDAVGALHRALGAIAAADGNLLREQLQKSLPRQRELAIAVGVGQAAQHVGDRQAFLACAVALSAHAAIERPDLLQMRGEQLVIAGGVRL